MKHTADGSKVVVGSVETWENIHLAQWEAAA